MPGQGGTRKIPPGALGQGTAGPCLGHPGANTKEMMSLEPTRKIYCANSENPGVSLLFSFLVVFSSPALGSEVVFWGLVQWQGEPS